MDNVISFTAYAAANGYAIASPPPRTRDHLPPVSAWTDAYRRDGSYIGAGIVIAHATDPDSVIVSIEGIRHVVHYTDCAWARIGGAAFQRD